MDEALFRLAVNKTDHKMKCHHNLSDSGDVSYWLITSYICFAVVNQSSTSQKSTSVCVSSWKQTYSTFYVLPFTLLNIFKNSNIKVMKALSRQTVGHLSSLLYCVNERYHTAASSGNATCFSSAFYSIASFIWRKTWQPLNVPGSLRVIYSVRAFTFPTCGEKHLMQNLFGELLPVLIMTLPDMETIAKLNASPLTAKAHMATHTKGSSW